MRRLDPLTALVRVCTTLCITGSLFRSVHTMPSQRVLQSVAHNFGDHAVSGLSYLAPHLFRAATSSGQLTTVVDALVPDLTFDDGRAARLRLCCRRGDDVLSGCTSLSVADPGCKSSTV